MNKKFDKLLGALRESDSNLTADQEAAISGAASPSGSNVFATMSSVASPSPLDINIKVVPFTVPVIPFGTRVVIDTNLGVLHNKTKTLIQFFGSTVTESYVKCCINNPSPQGMLNGWGDCYLINRTKLPSYFMTLYGLTGQAMAGSLLFVTENYHEASRHYPCAAQTTGSREVYNASLNFPNIGWTYDQLGVGVLIGWYSMGSGFLKIGTKIQCQSAWLSQSGNDTILSIALENVDTYNNVLSAFKIGIYD